MICPFLATFYGSITIKSIYGERPMKDETKVIVDEDVVLECLANAEEVGICSQNVTND